MDFGLFVLFFIVIRSDSAPYPIYNGTGSHFEAGVAIGEQGKDRIQAYLATYPTMPKLRNCLLTACAVDFRDLVEYNQAIWPQYFEELSGIAQGANVEEIDLQLLSLKHEVLAVEDQINNVQTPINDIDLQCSDILLNKKTFQGFGHNEDGWGGVNGTGYFSHYKIINSSTSDIENEFMGFQYPGSIIGHAFGFNNHGISVSMNAVFPSNVTIPARGCYFICRAILDANDMTDAINIVNDYKENEPACSYGASLNIGYMDKNNNNQVSIANVEISNYNVSVEYYGEDKQESYGYHYNMYLRLNVSQKTDQSSIHRLNRTLQLIDENGLNTAQDIQNILGDTQDSEYPIYRDSNPPDDSSTLTTAIFDVTSKSLTVYEKCNPKTCDSSFTVHFDFTDFCFN